MIMTSNGFFCETGGKDQVCDLTIKDFLSFLESYPQNIITRESLIAEKYR